MSLEKNQKIRWKVKRKFGNNWQQNKKAVVKILKKRQYGLCTYCLKGFNGEIESVDHIIPFSMGGESILNNFQLLHLECHRKKDGAVRKRNFLHHHARRCYFRVRYFVRKITNPTPVEIIKR